MSGMQKLCLPLGCPALQWTWRIRCPGDSFSACYCCDTMLRSFGRGNLQWKCRGEHGKVCDWLKLLWRHSRIPFSAQAFWAGKFVLNGFSGMASSVNYLSYQLPADLSKRMIKLMWATFIDQCKIYWIPPISKISVCVRPGGGRYRLPGTHGLKSLWAPKKGGQNSMCCRRAKK